MTGSHSDTAGGTIAERNVQAWLRPIIGFIVCALIVGCAALAAGFGYYSIACYDGNGSWVILMAMVLLLVFPVPTLFLWAAISLVATVLIRPLLSARRLAVVAGASVVAMLILYGAGSLIAQGMHATARCTLGF